MAVLDFVKVSGKKLPKRKLITGDMVIYGDYMQSGSRPGMGKRLDFWTEIFGKEK